MEIKKIEANFSICKVTDYSEVKASDPFVFTAQTD